MRKNVFILFAAAMLSGMALISCEKERMWEEELCKPAEGYDLTLQATKTADAQTKTLAVSGSTVVATWSNTDVVSVYRESTLLGTLNVTPDDVDATRAVLSGSLTSAPSAGDNLTLKYLSANYASQDGTLTGNDTSIDKVCDYAVATATVSSVNTLSRTIAIVGGTASFVNQQAIVKFTLQDTNGDALNVTSLTIYDGSATYTVNPSSATDVLYVALPGISGRTLSLSALSGDDTYRYEKSGVSLSGGYYYTKTVRLGFELEYLEYSVAAGNYSVKTKVPGTFTSLTSSTTNWNGWYVVRGNTTISGRITVNGTANLILCDGATLTASSGITVNSGNTLNIFAQSAGTGTLNAYGYSYEFEDPGIEFEDPGMMMPEYGAAIGGLSYSNCGTVNIHGGNIRADANENWYCPGIGGQEGNCGSITIYGGTVYARGGNMAGGIGYGGSNAGGSLTVYGGDVTATTVNAAAIGGNDNGITVNIHGGRVVADASDATYGAGIGGGPAGNGGNVTITGGTVIASGGAGTGSYGMATGIGAGNAYGSNVLSNGTLTLGSGMVVYGGTSPNPDGNEVYGPIDNVSTRYRYMIVTSAPAGPPSGAIDGLFTINASGDQVYFSQGNLKYSNGTWSFHTHQYDMCFTSTGDVAANYTSSGTFDLFGYGTSGYNNKYPYMTSTNRSDYYESDIAGTEYDWGVHNTVNGGTGWRTLTWPEWDYLLNTRTTTSGLRWHSGSVNNVLGIILLPDNWTNPYPSVIFNSKEDFDSDQWSTIFEPTGAVFLPVFGYRGGTNVMLEGSVIRSGYWTSTYYSGYPYCVDIYASAPHQRYDQPVMAGNFVRLVKDAE